MEASRGPAAATAPSEVASDGNSVCLGGCSPQPPTADEDNWRRPVSVADSIATATDGGGGGGGGGEGSQTDGLLYYSREPLRLKNFCAEVRAPMDVEQFAHQAELVLDSPLVSMSDIVDEMLSKVFKNEALELDEKLREARETIFIPGSSMLLARTIQGVSKQPGDQCALRHDQMWLCTLCDLAQISRRHVVIARFKQPINMGENAHEVRLFVLVVVPIKEKSTKSTLETGRTFATMLTDSEFRQRLLNAPNEAEFKAQMVVQAQQLARLPALKNRHKYLLDPLVNRSISSSANSPQNNSPRDSSTKQPAGLVAKLAAPADGSAQSAFRRNSRTSKLFELISMSNEQQENKLRQDTDLESVQAKLGAVLASGGVGGADTDLVGYVGPTENGVASSNGETKSGGGYSVAAASGKRPKAGPKNKCCSEFGKGLISDLSHRIRYYPSDFKDAFVGPPRTIQKTIATIWFLYFGILLPTIAFSSLNTSQTNGHMGDLRKAIIGQAFGGLAFALLGGQPLVIIMTTAPLCLYTKVIHQMCIDYEFHFPSMYAAVGLWNGFFLMIYSLFGFSRLMKWCTRSTEEIFALFIVVAFVTDACKDMIKNFAMFYYTPACVAQDSLTSAQLLLLSDQANNTGQRETNSLLKGELNSAPETATNETLLNSQKTSVEDLICRRETSLLFVLLMLGTLLLAVTFYRFKKTPYLGAGKRELLADYALPAAVVLMSYFGSFVFDDIFVEKFPPIVGISFERAPVESLPLGGILTSLCLGFTLSLLFFMDQNISAAMVNAPQNRLKKGAAYHYDLFVVGLLNGLLTLYGLPMMHGVLPHSPLHVRSLADIEEQVEEGHVREVIVNCRETRVTAIVSHILVLASLLLVPYPVAYIPRAVLNGLFLYMAVTSLDGLQFFERILLLFTEQSKYPPNHYIRRCPQRKIHGFTMLQLLQLMVMCFFGFSPFNVVEMFFPVIILLMIPFRLKVVPKFIDKKYLDALDGKHI